MTVQRAKFERRAAPLSSDWGYKVACEKFGRDFVDGFPRYSRGPRKGLLKGYLTWIKCYEGGWVRQIPGALGRGGVLRPGTCDWNLTFNRDVSMREHGRVASWSWNGGSPNVEIHQDPADAEVALKKYRDEARYA